MVKKLFTKPSKRFSQSQNSINCNEEHAQTFDYILKKYIKAKNRVLWKIQAPMVPWFPASKHLGQSNRSLNKFREKVKSYKNYEGYRRNWRIHIENPPVFEEKLYTLPIRQHLQHHTQLKYIYLMDSNRPELKQTQRKYTKIELEKQSKGHQSVPEIIFASKWKQNFREKHKRELFLQAKAETVATIRVRREFNDQGKTKTI